MFCILLLIIILYSYKTISRNTAWKDDLTLFLTDVKTSYNSAKCNYDAANTLTIYADKTTDEQQKSKYVQSSINYAVKAFKIYPNYLDNLLNIGKDYYYKKNYDSLLFYYRILLKKAPYQLKGFSETFLYFFRIIKMLIILSKFLMNCILSIRMIIM